MDIVGEVLEEIKKFNDCSQNIIFSDPPYNLGSEWYMASNGKPECKKASDFMNKWNGLTGPELEFMFQDFLRVLKYGSYCVFAGQMRQAMSFQYYAIAAGFDMIEPIYSYSIANFPKSLDVSKSIDKIGKRINMFELFSKYIKEQRIKKELNTNDIAKFFPSKTGNITGCYRNWEYGNNVPTKKQYGILKPLLELSDEFDDLINRIEYEREIIGNRIMPKTLYQRIGEGDSESWNKNITAPCSDLAKKYNGIKSSICPLKQTTEVWFIFRKPFKHKTVVQDIIAYEDGDDTITPGGLNIDAGRVQLLSSDNLERKNKTNPYNPNGNTWRGGTNNCKGLYLNNSTGRYPAQLFLDGSISYKREEIDLENKDFLEFVGIDPDVIKYMTEEKALDYICDHLDKFDVSKVLDEQSGVTIGSGKPKNSFHKPSINIAMNGKNLGHQTLSDIGDTGGCSRILHNSSFTLTELYQHIFYSKASGYERNAGCENLKNSDRFGAGNYSQSPVCFICQKTINGINNHCECEKEPGYKIEYIRKEENNMQRNNHPTLKSMKLIYNIIQLFHTVDIEKMKILVPFSGVRSEKIAWLAHGALEENIIAIEGEQKYHDIGAAREKFWIDNNFFFRDDKIMQSKIKTSIEKEDNIKNTGQANLF